MANKSATTILSFSKPEELTVPPLNIKEFIADKNCRRLHDGYIKEYMRTGNSRNMLRSGTSTVVLIVILWISAILPMFYKTICQSGQG